MTETYAIAGYARISVDLELDRDNTSIENQKDIIEDYVKQRFPGSSLTFYEDRDRSGYTFEQREQYQEMRRGLMAHRYDILIVKDFSRFSRRNSRGLVELEDLRDAGVRIISVSDGIDFPNDDDWLKIQFQFLINEMPVTDTSKKIKAVIKRRQADGKWICAAPFGYKVNKKSEFEIVPESAAVVKKIFELYNEEGYGYKKIAKYLTDHAIPTPRMTEKMRAEAEGGENRQIAKREWSLITVQEILDNDFYIGTLRQGKYTRAKINGKDVKKDEADHIVIEDHHPAIIDYKTFAETQELRKHRSKTNYRGVKKHENVYAGFLRCGDCGAPMFCRNRPNLAPAYLCGTYFRLGRAHCSAHTIRADKLDAIVKTYIARLIDTSSAMLESLEREEKVGKIDERNADVTISKLTETIAGLREELKATKRQRIRDIMKHPEQEEVLDETYDELENEVQSKIEGLTNQIELIQQSRSDNIRIRRTAKTLTEVFRDILCKDSLDKRDVGMIVDTIVVYKDHVEIKLKPDVDAILRAGDADTSMSVLPTEEDKIAPIGVDVINDGDPLEIYTDREGEVIFKKYSPIGELAQFAGQYAETLSKTCGLSVVICDRDAVIACAGVPKRDYADRKLTAEVERIVENRQLYVPAGGETVSVVEGGQPVGCLMPIITEGDIAGCVASVRGEEKSPVAPDVEAKLVQTAALFLGKQLES